MKNLIFLFLVAVISTGQAQVIQLEEAKVNFSPKAVLVSSGPGGVVMKIPEMYVGQFQKDPVLFMKENFNILSYIEQSKKQNYDTYIVNFRSRNGHLEANFNKNGDLVSTFQKFKNVRLPRAISNDIVKSYKGWTIQNNTYVARSKANLQKELYKVKIKNGKEGKILKFKPEPVSLASN